MMCGIKYFQAQKISTLTGVTKEFSGVQGMLTEGEGAMYKWNIEIILKSGEHIFGYYEGEETDSNDVANKLLTGSQHTLNSIARNETGQLWYLVGEVAACIVSIR